MNRQHVNKVSGVSLFMSMSLALALAVTGQVAKATESEPEEVSYTYVSLEYEVSNAHLGSEGWTLGFCFEVANPFHVFGGGQLTDIDLGDVAPGVEGYREGYLVGGGISNISVRA